MRTLSLYLTRIFLSRFLLLLFGLSLFLLSLDLIVNSGEVMDSRDGQASAVLLYAGLRLPEIVSQLVQVATLLAGLITLAQLVRNSELVAIWNAGVSPLRTLLCFMPVAMLAGLLQFLVDDRLIPETLSRLNAWGVGDYGRANNLRGAEDVVWLRAGDDIVRLPAGALNEQPLRNITIFKRDPDGRLLARQDAEQAAPQDGIWILTNVTSRSVVDQSTLFEPRVEWQTDLKISGLDAATLPPRELTTPELIYFVHDKGLGFWPPYLYQTWLQKRIATIFAPLLLIFLIIPLAQRFQRSGGLALMFVIGIGVGFFYFVLDRASLALGEAGLLPAFVASWAPSLALACLAAGLAFHYELRMRSEPQPTAHEHP